jgi:hypothetical protein
VTTVGANAKQTRKAPQINRRCFVAIFESRSATPANTAIMEAGIEVNVASPTANGTNDASILSAGHQSQQPKNIPPHPPRTEAIRSRRHPSLDKAVASPVINAMRISGVFHPGRSRLGGVILGHQHIAEPAATIRMSSVFLCICSRRRKSGRRWFGRLIPPADRGQKHPRPGFPNAGLGC